MKKQFSKALLIFFLLPIVAGCATYDAEQEETIAMPPHYIDSAPYNAENEPNTLDINESPEQPEISFSVRRHLNFSSVEELLNDYIAAIEGRVHPNSDIARNTEYVNFAGLNELQLLANIPEDFQLSFIDIINRYWFWSIYRHIDDDGVSEIWNNMSIILQVGRHAPDDVSETWGVDCPLLFYMSRHGYTENDLIDNKYWLRLFDEHVYILEWAEGSKLFILSIPRVIVHGSDNISPYIDMSNSSQDFPQSILHLAETITIDLQCEDNITAWSNGDFSTIEAMLNE
jgi:hypothetical protein